MNNVTEALTFIAKAKSQRYNVSELRDIARKALSLETPHSYIEIEQENPSELLRELAAHIRQEDFRLRATAARVVRSYGYHAYIGGGHVAVLTNERARTYCFDYRKSSRLALI